MIIAYARLTNWEGERGGGDREARGGWVVR